MSDIQRGRLKLHLSLSDLPLDFLQLFPDGPQEVLEVFLLGVELFELALDAAVFVFVVGQVPLAALLQIYSSSWMRSSSVESVRRISAFLASNAFSKASLACLKAYVSRL